MSSPEGGSGADYRIPAHRLPSGFVETISQAPDRPSEPREAATVVLLRDGDGGPQALLLRRNSKAGFVPRAWVFPGGRVDPADGEDALAERWTGLGREEAATRLGLPRDASPQAIAYYGAAVREAIEETGLWPGVTHAGGALASEAAKGSRERLLGEGATLAAVLGEIDARLDGAAFEYIAHWVTPVAEPRRYDTRFFAARVPSDAVAHHDEREMTASVWLTPQEALARHREGRLPMIFPTIRTLEGLRGFDTVAELLAHFRGRAIPRQQPEIVRTADGVALRME